MKRMRRSLNVQSDDEQIPKAPERMTPLEDLQTFAGFIPIKKREKLKTRLRSIGKDIMAPTTQTRNLMKHLSSAVATEITPIVGAYATNVKQLIELRLQRLSLQHKLRFGGPFNDKVWLCLLGDKGNNTTKVGVTIGNVLDSNSPSNITTIGIYEGTDDLKTLREAFQPALFNQVNALRTVKFPFEGQIVTKEVVLFMTGDYMFLCAMLGHIGPHAAFPCPLCQVANTNLKNNMESAARDLESMEKAAQEYAKGSSASMSQTKKTKLNKACMGISAAPVLNIPIVNVIPSSLHIMQGLAQDVLNRVEAVAKELAVYAELERLYETKGASKKAW